MITSLAKQSGLHWAERVLGWCGRIFRFASFEHPLSLGAESGFAVKGMLPVLALAASIPTIADAETLGRVTAIDYSSSSIEIEGRLFDVGAQTSISAATRENKLETVTFRSLAENDYVLYEESDGALLKLQRVLRDGIDVAPPRTTTSQGGRRD